MGSADSQGRRAARLRLAGYVARRLAAGLVSLAIVSVLVFAATNLLPGDAAVAALGRDATPSASRACARRSDSTSRSSSATRIGSADSCKEIWVTP